MRYAQVLAWTLLVSLVVAGCRKDGEERGTTAAGDQPANQTDAAAAKVAASETPEGAVRQFLDAVRTGDDKKTEDMFTKLAREKIKELEDIQVAPPGSDTAKFEIGKVEYIEDDGARVATRWTDLDKEGKARTDDILWMVRKEPEGWRIAGMAATVFEGEDPLTLDFENPRDTLRKLDLLKQEMRRRAEKSTEQAQQTENPPESVRR